jgi:hypothetical protein
MRRLLVLIMLPVSAAMGLNYTLCTSGSVWGNASAWSSSGSCPGTPGIPGIGDTANIPDRKTVIAQSVTVGTSGTNGTVAVNLNNSGQILVKGSFTTRGDVVYTANNCGNTGVAVTLAAGSGSTWTFDSSAAASPAATHYAFGPKGPYGCRGFYSYGTAAVRNTVNSNPAGGAGQFSARGGSGINGPFIFAYTDFVKIGDASNPGWQVGYDHGGSDPIQWNATYSTFTNCGMIQDIDSTVGIDSTGTFVHAYNIHANSQGTQIFGHWTNIVPNTKGTRVIRNNLFDISLADTASGGFQAISFSVWSNYFSDADYLAARWASNQGNFRRCVNQVGGTCWLVDADVVDAYFFYDTDTFNPHVTTGVGRVTGAVFGQGGNAIQGGSDSGELGNGTSSILNSILLPNAAGYSSAEFFSLLPGQTTIIEHNTYFGGYTNATPGPGEATHSFGAIDLGEGSCNPTSCPSGAIRSFKDNILWNPEVSGHTASFFKALDISYTGSVTDYCAPANCDYNLGYNYTAKYPAHAAQFTNQGNGYAAKFSSTPGAHDLECVVAACSPTAVNPMFVDYQRSVELFDSKYLGYSPAAWSSGSTYSIGNMVSTTNSNIYWGLPVNYRYINGGSCGGANPKPGSGANWRSCWEWASLYHIRQAVAASTTWNGRTPQTCPGKGVWSTPHGVGQCLWDDQTIGAQGVDIVLTLIHWVRAGYSPTNPLLAGHAHDHKDIGAVPVTLQKK